MYRDFNSLKKNIKGTTHWASLKVGDLNILRHTGMVFSSLYRWHAMRVNRYPTCWCISSCQDEKTTGNKRTLNEFVPRPIIGWWYQDLWFGKTEKISLRAMAALLLMRFLQLRMRRMPILKAVALLNINGGFLSVKRIHIMKYYFISKETYCFIPRIELHIDSFLLLYLADINPSVKSICKIHPWNLRVS